jgi:hypothetical protein
LKHGSLNLAPECLRIDYPAAGDRNNDLRNLNSSARPVDKHLGDDCPKFLRHVLTERDPTAAHNGLSSIGPARWPGLPLSLLHRGVEHLQSHRISEIVTTKFNRIRLLFGRDLVHE